MPVEWFRKYPATVTLPDGRVVARGLVLHVGDDLAVYAARSAHPDGEATRSPRIVRVATFPRELEDGTKAKVRQVEKNVWTIPTDAGDVQIVKAGGCGCNDPLKTWRP